MTGVEGKVILVPSFIQVYTEVACCNPRHISGIGCFSLSTLMVDELSYEIISPMYITVFKIIEYNYISYIIQ